MNRIESFMKKFVEIKKVPEFQEQIRNVVFQRKMSIFKNRKLVISFNKHIHKG